MNCYFKYAFENVPRKWQYLTRKIAERIIFLVAFSAFQIFVRQIKMSAAMHFYHNRPRWCIDTFIRNNIFISWIFCIRNFERTLRLDARLNIFAFDGSKCFDVDRALCEIRLFRIFNFEVRDQLVGARGHAAK